LNAVAEQYVTVAGMGEDMELVVGAAPEGDSTSTTPQADMPAAVDNSKLKYFPPISSQGNLPSCGVYNGTYYAMTYMYALARDLDAKNGGAAYQLSPKWTYNMVNSGELVGTWYYQAYDIGMKHGCATMAEFPYAGATSPVTNYREWNRNPLVWRNAIDRKFSQYGYVDNTDKDSGIQLVKEMLNNGYILNFPTYINSWQWKTIGNDPSTTADDAFVGKGCAYWVNGTSGYHAMTVVGYNDDIWVDINGNGAVDAGEKGAFRIANSWGTGWRESGFAWMSYDALKNPSAVAGGPVTNRVLGWSPARAHWVTATTSYQPTMVAEFTLNHLKRNQLRLTLGTSDPTATSPSISWQPKMIYSQGGAYAFDGTTTAINGSFVFDFSDIAPSGTQSKKYYLGMYDSITGDTVELSSYKLIDVKNGDVITECHDVPKVTDAGQGYAYVNYVYSDGNIAPTAHISLTTPSSGDAPLAVSFHGNLSTDADGSITSYYWSFGDGGSASGVSTSHTYTTPGNYTATLTVYDDKGAAHSDTAAITVTQPPVRSMYISDIDMSISFAGTNATAKARITVKDETGNPVPNATVIGNWTGLVKGTVSGITGLDGCVVVNSAKSKKSGTFTFTITGVTASGYYYDALQNRETSDSISTSAVPSDADDGAHEVVKMQIPNIYMDVSTSPAGNAALSTVQVTDLGGNPLAGVNVAGKWSGLVSGSVSGLTDALGQATFLSKKTRSAGPFIFTITNVSSKGYEFDPANSVTVNTLNN
jgi:PKD repeat protein/C1A family cysteine protease